MLSLHRLSGGRDEAVAAARVLPRVPRTDRERRGGRVCAGVYMFMRVYAGVLVLWSV